jgi:ankyrin repeat protein
MIPNDVWSIIISYLNNPKEIYLYTMQLNSSIFSHAWSVLDKTVKNHLSIRHAARMGHVTYVMHLLDEEEWKVDPCVNKNEPMISASCYGHTEVVRYLLKHPRVQLTDSNGGTSALSAACTCVHPDTVKLLLEHGIKPDVHIGTSVSGSNQTTIMKLLIEYGYKPTFPILQEAVNKNRLEMVQLLLDSTDLNPSALNNSLVKSARAEVRSYLSNHSLVFQQALSDFYFPHVDLLEHILLQCDKDEYFNNATRIVSQAVKRKHDEFLSVLLKDSRVTNKLNMNSVFLVACKSGFVRVVEQLISELDPTYKDNEAIKLACRYGHTEVATTLLNDYRVDPSVCHNYCITVAAMHGFTGICKLLLQDRRVDPSANSSDPLRRAKQNGHKRIVEILPPVNSEIIYRK